MFDYLNGLVTVAEINYITIDCNGVGYKVYVACPYRYNCDEVYKVYIYNHVREEENTLYGFYSYEERELFLKLISVKGLGPKMGISILASGSINGIIDAIDRENILYLKKFPKIGEKLARQIILDLKGKLVLTEDTDKSNDELVLLALKNLG